MKYVNEYTLGATAFVATTAAFAYFSPAAVLTVPHVAGLALLAAAAVAGSYAAYLGVKATYSYFTADAKVQSKVEPIAKRTRAGKKKAEETAKNDTVVNTVKAKAANGVAAVKDAAASSASALKDTASSVSTGISSRFNSAVQYVKSFFGTEEVAKEVAKEVATEVAKEVAKEVATEAVEEAAKPAKQVAEKAPAKAVTPTFAAKKAAAKKVAHVAANRPVRANRENVNYAGM